MLTFSIKYYQSINNWYGLIYDYNWYFKSYKFEFIFKHIHIF